MFGGPRRRGPTGRLGAIRPMLPLGARITPCGRNGAVSGPAEHSDGWPAPPP